jgi:hypothetical protein
VAKYDHHLQSLQLPSHLHDQRAKEVASPLHSHSKPVLQAMPSGCSAGARHSLMYSEVFPGAHSHPSPIPPPKPTHPVTHMHIQVPPKGRKCTCEAVRRGPRSCPHSHRQCPSCRSCYSSIGQRLRVVSIRSCAVSCFWCALTPLTTIPTPPNPTHRLTHMHIQVPPARLRTHLRSYKAQLL